MKILRKNSRKKSFLANFFNEFARKILCNMKLFSSDNHSWLIVPMVELKTSIDFI